MLPVCAVSLKLKGYNRTRRQFQSGRKRPSSLPRTRQLQIAKRAARAVNIASNHGFYRANCLKRSLVLNRWLLKRGIEAEIKLGVDLFEGDLAAHAWVEHQGTILNDHRNIGRRFKTMTPDLPDDWETHF